MALAVDGTSVQLVIGSVLSSYYAARSVPADQRRFRGTLEDDDQRLIRAALSRLEALLTRRAGALHRLALSDAASDGLARQITSSPSNEAEWAAFERSVSRLSRATAHLTRALRGRKQSGDFIEPGSGGRLTTSRAESAEEAMVGDGRRALNRQIMALEVLAGEDRPQSNPIRILVDVTNQCNFRCRTCYQSSSQDFAFYDLAGDTFERLEPFLRTASAVCFAGTGEPLLSPDTPQAIRFAASVGAGTELVTNGSLLGRVVDLERDLARIFVSFDGATEQTLGILRKGAQFGSITRGIQSLPTLLRRRVVLNMVVCRANVREIEQMARLARRLEVGELHLQSFHAYLPWHSELVLQEEDQLELSRQVRLARAALFGSGVRLGVMLPVRPEAACSEPDSPSGSTPANVLTHLAVVSDPKPAVPSLDEQPAVEFAESTDVSLPATVLSALERVEGAASVREPGHPGSTDLSGRLRELLPVVQGRSPLRVPHCIAPYALLYLQGDGTTRPCCVIDARAGDVTSADLRTFWHSPAYVALRHALTTGIDLPRACHGCADGSRFAMLGELLEEARLLGVDLRALVIPDDPGVPESVRALVRSAIARGSADESRLQGYLDRLLGRSVIGWAMHPDVPGRAESVDVVVDGARYCRVAADEFRPDLLEAGIGEGHHGFVVTLPESFADRKEHVIEVRFSGTERHLAGSPVTVRLSG